MYATAVISFMQCKIVIMRKRALFLLMGTWHDRSGCDGIAKLHGFKQI